MIPEIIGTLSGAALGIAGGFAGFWLQRRYEGRQKFHAVTAEIRAELDLAPLNAPDIFEHSKSKLAHAIQLCRPHVWPHQFERLHAVWREYHSQHREDLDETNSGRGVTATIANDWKGPQERLAAYLDRFDECITKSA
jgi:hypothetical protein